MRGRETPARRLLADLSFALAAVKANKPTGDVGMTAPEPSDEGATD